ncbi:MAG TPA: sigma-70 family RNA polymerase sigma factor [Gammaproteobacteria bacterium]
MQQRPEAEALNLLRQALAGDQAAFCSFAENYRRLIYQIAIRYLNNEADAMDACQDVMMNILRKGHLYRGDGSLEGWVRTVTVNTCKNAIRSRHPERFDDGHDPDSLPSGDSPEQCVAGLQHSAHVRQCIGQLPDKQRMTVILKIYEDMTLQEIAGSLNCTLGTAKANFFHAVAKLKQCLERLL